MNICEYGTGTADTVLIQPVDRQDLKAMDNEIREIERMAARDFCLIAVQTQNWNNDLSPWEAEPVFGKDGFAGGAQDTLDEILKLCSDRNKTYIIGGYSLAALFSLWAVYQTDVFAAAAAASPSIWFPGFIDYMKDNEIKCGRVYLSLGDREEKTKNPVMRTVGESIRSAYRILSDNKTACVLEWNKGNHFNEPDLRTARAFADTLSYYA